jgi:hypothetical protein
MPARAQVISLKGKVLHEQTGEPVSFAHVGICNKSIGAVANESGDYMLNIPSYLAADSICATAIGYETYRKSIAELAGAKELNLALVPQTLMLGDVLIKDEKITARRVIEKAIRRIPKNYPKKPFALEGYYRDYLKKNNAYAGFLEGAMYVKDPGYRNDAEKTNLEILQMRYNDAYAPAFEEYVLDFEDDTTKLLIHGILPTMNGNEFMNMVHNNPIRNYSESVPFIGTFETFAERNYDFQIEYYTYLDDKEVCVINIAPSKNFRFTHVAIEGKMYVRTDNFAIVKFSYAYFVTKRLETKKWYELNVEYREHEGKMYLKYISYMNYFKLMTQKEIADLAIYREFFVTDIFTNQEPPVGNATPLDTRQPLYVQQASNDPQFWIDYNRTLLEQPLKE